MASVQGQINVLTLKLEHLAHFQPLFCEYELLSFSNSSHIFLFFLIWLHCRKKFSIFTYKERKWAARDLKAISSKSVIAEVHLSFQMHTEDFVLSWRHPVKVTTTLARNEDAQLDVAERPSASEQQLWQDSSKSTILSSPLLKSHSEAQQSK